MRERTSVRAGGGRVAAARRRVREALAPASHAALGAALSWLIARHVLGHADPFFAPVAAAVALGTTHLQRSPRIVQMVLGVLLGIAVGSVLAGLLGVSTPALGLIVLVTLLAARALGVGFVGDGLTFANQAVGSAIIVAVLHHSGTGAERAVDVLVGGAVALLVGVVLFPARPMPRLRTAEQAVLESLARVLWQVAALQRAGTRAESGWTLAAAHEVHQRLAELTGARQSARANVRIAPRRWPLRRIVDAEEQRLARLHLLADAVLALVRAADSAVEGGQPLSAGADRRLSALGTAIGRLASTPQPWPPPLVRAVDEAAARAALRPAGDPVDWGPVVASALDTTARDLREVLEADGAADDPRGQPRPVRGAPPAAYHAGSIFRRAAARPVNHHKRN